jgi:hypothetical protein
MQRVRGGQTESRVFLLNTRKKNLRERNYVDAAGKAKSLVRKCSELNTKDVSDRNDKLYIELTQDTHLSCEEDMVWFSQSCRCVRVWERERARACFEEMVFGPVCRAGGGGREGGGGGGGGGGERERKRESLNREYRVWLGVLWRCGCVVGWGTGGHDTHTNI